MKKIAQVLLLVIILTSIPVRKGLAYQTVEYPVPPVYPPPLERPEADLDLTALMDGAVGAFPTFDGEAFQVNLPPGLAMDFSEEEVREILARILPALGWLRNPEELAYVGTIPLPLPDMSFLEGQLDEKREQFIASLEKRLGRLSESTLQAITEADNEVLRKAALDDQIMIFEQLFDGVRMDHTDIVARWQEETGLLYLTGRVFNDVRPENEVILDETNAIETAVEYIARYIEPVRDQFDRPELIILPYRAGFLFSWRLEVKTIHEGAYRLWINAQDGNVLQLYPLFFADDGQGRGFNPDPNVGTKQFLFQVDPAANKLYQLRYTGVLDVNNLGADGVTNSDLTIAAGTGYKADFDVSPINGTVVQCKTNTGYNSRFQEVNAYAWVYYDTTFLQFMGSKKFSALTLNVNDPNPCFLGRDNACGGGNTLAFGVGTATVNCTTNPAHSHNAALDATVITHELGHTLNGMQFVAKGSVLHGSLNEGLADFWAMTIHDTDTFGSWWSQNEGAAGQGPGGWRQAEDQDVFPEHRAGGNTDVHADGQMAAWALWSARNGFEYLASLGEYGLNIALLKAMTAAGVGVIDTQDDLDVHNAYLNILQKLATETKSSSTIHKVLSGFARAGITLSERDAIIDINDDFLAKTAATGPTFTVWTGRDYQFSGQNATAANVFNTNYTVEVANDAKFTSNLVSSGNQTNVAVNAVGIPQGTWTMPASDWQKLRSGTRLYYRVTTRDNSNGNLRESSKPGNKFLENIPPAFAVINDTGAAECTCGPSTGANPLDRALSILILTPLVLAFIWRQRARKD